MRGPYLKYKLLSLLIGILAAIIASVLSNQLGLLKDLELRTLDVRFFLRPDTPQSQRIAHIDIDDKSIDYIEYWPWKRDIHATLIKNLTDLGARAIVFDVEFINRQERYVDVKKSLETRQAVWVDPDEVFAEAIKNSGIVYLPIGFPQDVKGYPLEERIISTSSYELKPHDKDIRRNGFIKSIERLNQYAKGFGSVDMPQADSDGIYRRVFLMHEFKGRLYLQLGLKVALDELEAESIEIAGDRLVVNIKKGVLNIPIDEKGNMLVNWVTTGRDAWIRMFEHIPCVKVLDLEDETLQSKINGKICFIGSSARAAADFKSTPASHNLPGVAFHSNICNMILENSFLYEPAHLYKSLIFLIFAIFAIYICTFASSIISAVSIVVVIIAYFIINFFIFYKASIILPVTNPTFGLIFPFFFITTYREFTEERMKKRIKDSFQLYLSRDLVDELINHPEKLKLGGDKMKATVMFTDIQGFSAFAEKSQPEDAIQILNNYLTVASNVVFYHGGYLDKYLGDGLMAVFGLGVSETVAARNACQAAIQIQRELRQKGSELPFEVTRIGIASGEVIVGNIGSTERKLNFTAVGDVVNIAARLQTLNKETKTRILIDETTCKHIDGFNVKPLGSYHLQGRVGAINVYNLLEEA